MAAGKQPPQEGMKRAAQGIFRRMAERKVGTCTYVRGAMDLTGERFTFSDTRARPHFA